MTKQLFQLIRVRFKLKLFAGRLTDNLNNPDNYNLAIRDQYSGILKWDDTLRNGEYIRLDDTFEIVDGDEDKRS